MYGRFCCKCHVHRNSGIIWLAQNIYSRQSPYPRFFFYSFQSCLGLNYCVLRSPRCVLPTRAVDWPNGCVSNHSTLNHIWKTSSLAQFLRTPLRCSGSYNIEEAFILTQFPASSPWRPIANRSLSRQSGQMLTTRYVESFDFQTSNGIIVLANNRIRLAAH